jgi:hypothetical protein
MAVGVSSVDVAFTEQYSSLVYILAQQKGSKLRSYVRNETVTGSKNAFFERLGTASAQQITTRHGDTPLNEIPHSRRRLTPADYNTATLLDTADRIKMLIDPKSPYANAQAMELGRTIDDIIITAALGDVSTGVAGATTVAFKDDSISINGDGTATTLGTLAVSGTEVDITLAKMLTMMQIFNDEDVDPDIPKYWVVSPKDLSDMLDLTEVGSADYNTVKTLVQGKVDTFMGFKWIWSTRLPLDAASEDCRRSFAWAEDGIILGSGESITSRITERDDKNYAVQVYSEMSCGAIRLEGAKVHECLNDL